MKICLIHNTWEEHARRGAEQFILTVTRALRAAGHDVSIITTRPWFKRAPHTPKAEQVYCLGSGYSYLEHWPLYARFVWHLCNVANPVKYFQIKKILDQKQPDIVWTHNLTGLGFLAFAAAKKYKHWHTIHDIQLLHPSGLLMYGNEKMLESFFSRIYQSISGFFITKKSIIISPSAWLLKLHQDYGFFKDNDQRVSPNPLEAKYFSKNISSKIKKEFSNFLYVGQIEAHKGISLLIAAAAEIQNPRFSLRLIGNGSLLENCVTKNKDPRIVFLGQQTSSRVREEMDQASCLVVPSICYENQPTVVFEAIASNLPAIGSNFAGVHEMLKDNHLLFEPTRENLKKKMEYVMENLEEMAGYANEAYSSLRITSAEEYILLLPW